MAARPVRRLRLEAADQGSIDQARFCPFVGGSLAG